MVEMFLGANPAAHLYWSGATLANIFFRNGTERTEGLGGNRR